MARARRLSSQPGRPADRTRGEGLLASSDGVPNRCSEFVRFGSVRFGGLVGLPVGWGWVVLVWLRTWCGTVGCSCRCRCGGVVTRSSSDLVFGVERWSGVIEQRPCGLWWCGAVGVAARRKVGGYGRVRARQRGTATASGSRPWSCLGKKANLVGVCVEAYERSS